MSKRREMLLWTLILVPIVILAAVAWRYRPLVNAEALSSREVVESQLMRLLKLFEDELRESEGDCEVTGLSSDGKALILSFGHQESVLSLPDLLRFAKVRGHQLHELVQELVEFLQENQSSVGDLSFELAIPDLLPQIRKMEWIQEHSPTFGPARLVRSPLVGDLRVCYVIDEAETMVFVTEAHLASWGASLDAIHNLAMENLARLESDRTPLMVDDHETMALRFIEEGDGYTATRLLLQLYGGGFDDSLVYGIPERDRMCYGACDDLCDAWRKRLAEAYGSGRHPLSPEFFRVEDQRLVPVDS